MVLLARDNTVTWVVPAALNFLPDLLGVPGSECEVTEIYTVLFRVVPFYQSELQYEFFF
jgi:hypothetical protein